MCDYRWTTAIPKADGWYWFQPPYSQPRIVEVMTFSGRPVYFVVGSKDIQQIREGVGRWSDRTIPPPAGV